jgi:Platelet-activating factor acetylhydrolase, isoform II
MTIRNALFVLAVCGFNCGASMLRAANQPSLPAPSGPFGVGRVGYEMIDTSRPEPLSADPAARRKMMVHVWYPIDGQTASGKETAPYLPGFEQVKDSLTKGSIADLFRPGIYEGPESLPETVVIENASIARGKLKFPLLLFAHGWGNPTYLYTAELGDIVSHGYIVVAIDHPYDTAFTRFPDGEVTFFAQDRFNTETAKKPHGLSNYAKERVEVMAQDNHFALTQILEYAATPSRGAPFLGRIDISKIGAFGHSIGGLTAARTCEIDARVKACMDQDSIDYRGSPFIVSEIDQTESQPFFLFVVSSADIWSQKVLHISDVDVAQQKLTRPEYDAIIKQQQENQTGQLNSIRGGSYRLMLFDLPGFIHRSFSDLTLLAAGPGRDENLHNFAVAQAYTLAFFDKYLKGINTTILDTGQSIDPRAKLERFPSYQPDGAH